MRSIVLVKQVWKCLPSVWLLNGQNIKLASSVTAYTIDAVKKSEYEGTDATNIYLDEIKGISVKQVETLSKSEIHTSEDFLTTERTDILTLKGFGEKTIDKISAIIVEAVSKKEAETKSKEIEETEESNDADSVLEKMEQD